MKKTPRLKHLEEMLHSSRIVAGGFLGTDRRELDEMIAADTAAVEAAGMTCEELADHMQAITDAAARGLGTRVTLAEGKEAAVDEVKGEIICPWPDDECRCNKRVTMLEDSSTGEQIRWTDLNIHLIREHRFFEGKGSSFRIEPDELIQMIKDIPCNLTECS